ncbi:hypothetical protein [Vibrio harveyi]|uniref:hypothetical protein n=1 Tax=Vibrio harveyi TaxID=669 RepID=UPI00237FF74A|nr:hypothetical protein [Vibrio harveyi]
MKLNRTVIAITAALGSGKSDKAMKAIGLAYRQNQKQFTLWASLTNELSEQSYEKFRLMFPDVPCVRIDSSTIKGDEFDEDRVYDALIQIGQKAARGDFDGIVFTSHASVLAAHKGVLKLARVIVDEIPTSAVDLITLTQLDKTYQKTLEYVQFEPCPDNPKFQKVSLKEDEETLCKVHNLVNNAKEGVRTGKKTYRDNTYSKDFISLLDHLLKGYKIVYYTIRQEDADSEEKRTVHVFQAIVYEPAQKLVSNADSLIILGSNIKESMFGIMVQSDHIGAEIKESSTIMQIELPRYHMHRNVRIVPYLTEGNISATLKEKHISEALEERQTEYGTIADDMQIFANRILGSDYLLFKNNDDKEYYSNYVKDYGVIVKSTQSHGQNQYRHINKAAYIAAANPAPDELKLLGVASRDLEIGSNSMTQAVITERYLDACFQCIGRTAIRNHNDLDVPCVFVVPDMRAADYLAERIPNAFIDVNQGYKRKKTINKEVIAKRNAAAEKRKQVLISILMDKKAKVGKMAEILKKHSISQPTFARYRKEFKNDADIQELL